jgi:hypothetical protein
MVVMIGMLEKPFPTFTWGSILTRLSDVNQCIPAVGAWPLILQTASAAKRSAVGSDSIQTESVIVYF